MPSIAAVFRRRPWAVLMVGVLLYHPGGSPARADEAARDPEGALRLRSHEPSLLGYTWDESGEFMDFTLSVKFKILEKSIAALNEGSSLNFAFTGRFGQYFERDSSPVIGKRYNPELFYRYEFESTQQTRPYIEVGYAHESNGQNIGSLSSYLQAQQTLERPQYADDYISRGWDFVRFTAHSPEYRRFGANHPLQLWATGRWFLRNGLFQGRPEEYSDWENSPEGKPRNQVDGLTAGVRYTPHTGFSWLPIGNLAVTYTTGYREIFRYHSYRVEAGVRVLDLPLIVWIARGYNSDLARYYRYVEAAGVGFTIGAF
jgi:hypothetical protein